MLRLYKYSIIPIVSIWFEDIKQKGLIQAIIVRKDPGNIGKYIVVAGERRLKACLLAGLEKIKCETYDTFEL